MNQRESKMWHFEKTGIVVETTTLSTDCCPLCPSWFLERQSFHMTVKGQTWYSYKTTGSASLFQWLRHCAVSFPNSNKPHTDCLKLRLAFYIKYDKLPKKRISLFAELNVKHIYKHMHLDFLSDGAARNSLSLATNCNDISQILHQIPQIDG